ncbi:MAG TPA: hypothetical protein VJZ32_10270 [Candidatus Bathyarchaeia archaeon]|nr:hypothetical protein [Candidatus Bathyarchaeia archaeon]
MFTLFGRRPKPKGNIPEDASALLRTVFTLDAMRIGIFAPELRHMHKSLRDTHSLTGDGMSWSAIRRDINDLINYPAKSEKITQYVRRLPILNSLLLVSFVLVGSIAALDFYFFRRIQPSLIIIPGLAVMMSISVLRWHYEESIRSFFEKNKPKADKIRRINNFLIGRLIAVLQKAKYPLEDCTFALYNFDYQNLAVKSKPKIFKGYYEVYPRTQAK